jgi:hypothetical protein
VRALRLVQAVDFDTRAADGFEGVQHDVVDGRSHFTMQAGDSELTCTADEVALIRPA